MFILPSELRNAITKEEFTKTLKYISLPIEESGYLVSQERQIDERFFHSCSPAQKYPLTEIIYISEHGLVCPSLYLFFKRITAGIFYDLIHEFGNGQFGDAIGQSYEHHIGQILSKANISGKFIQIDDSEGRSHRTVDWIYHDNEPASFIECKTQQVALCETRIERNE